MTCRSKFLVWNHALLWIETQKRNIRWYFLGWFYSNLLSLATPLSVKSTSPDSPGALKV